MIRSLYTFIKNKLPTKSTVRDTHAWFAQKDIMPAERFDKMIESVTHKIKTKYLLEKPKMRQEPNTTLPSPRTGMINRCVIDAMLYPKAGTIKFLR